MRTFISALVALVLLTLVGVPVFEHLPDGWVVVGLFAVFAAAWYGLTSALLWAWGKVG